MDRVIRSFIRKTAENLVNQPSGVYLKGIGYFYVHENVIFNAEHFRKTSRYFPCFIPDTKSCLKNFTFDYRFDRRVSRAIDKRTSSGARYLNWGSVYYEKLKNNSAKNKL